MSSGLDCIGCGGYLSLEHLGKVRICEACRGRKRDDRPDCETCEYSPGAIYQHAADCYDDESDEPNLCSGSGVHETDCRGEWIPCPACSDPVAQSSDDGLAHGVTVHWLEDAEQWVAEIHPAGMDDSITFWADNRKQLEDLGFAIATAAVAAEGKGPEQSTEMDEPDAHRPAAASGGESDR